MHQVIHGFYLKTRRGLRGSTKANGRDPQSYLGQVFNSKLGCFSYECELHGIDKQAHILS